MLLVLTSLAQAQSKPAPLSALEKQGATIVGTFDSPGGLTAWAAYLGSHPVALYVTPDGQHVIAGTMLDVDGKDITQAALREVVKAPMTNEVWNRLAASSWIADGQAKAPRTVYVFTDPNCPYCNKFWMDARPWVDSGKVQLRHVIVGVLTPSSPAKAAALLNDKNPSQLLFNYERSHAGATKLAVASGRVRPLDDAGLKPLEKVPTAVQARIAANERLMNELGLQATPAVAFQDDKGQLQTLTGIPPSELTRVLGQR
jgi:thiol:disulfide interchange protein DsbG